MNANRVRRLLLLALVCAGIGSGCRSPASRQLERDVSAELDPRNKWLDHKAPSGREPDAAAKQQRVPNDADFRTGSFDVWPVGSR